MSKFIKHLQHIQYQDHWRAKPLPPACVRTKWMTPKGFFKSSNVESCSVTLFKLCFSPTYILRISNPKMDVPSQHQNLYQFFNFIVWNIWHERKFTVLAWLGKEWRFSVNHMGDSKSWFLQPGLFKPFWALARGKLGSLISRSTFSKLIFKFS